MKEELKTILENIVADLKEQGHDPMDRPIVFIWTYPDSVLRYTLMIQKDEGSDDEEGEVVH